MERKTKLLHEHFVSQRSKDWFDGETFMGVARLRVCNPISKFVGMLSPPFGPFTEADEVPFVDTINRADPDFVWVALPCVRMERWVVDNQAR